MLSIDGARGGYGKTQILDGATLQVADGEVVALLGRNGVGKTTLMRYAMGLVDSFAGEVRLDGVRLASAPAKRSRAGLGYVPQGRFVFPRLTVAENIVAAAAAHGHRGRDAVAAALESFPMLAPKAGTLAGNLSGGQQQVLAMARALATRPRVLLLDEPTEGIQPSIVDDIAAIIRRLNRESGLAILLAEQDLDFCTSVAGRAYVMDRGTIVRQVATADLTADSDLVQKLLGV
jgi:urea ABC transporter ATP-binding protein UrtE